MYCKFSVVFEILPLIEKKEKYIHVSPSSMVCLSVYRPKLHVFPFQTSMELQNNQRQCQVRLSLCASKITQGATDSVYENTPIYRACEWGWNILSASIYGIHYRTCSSREFAVHSNSDISVLLHSARYSNRNGVSILQFVVKEKTILILW